MRPLVALLLAAAALAAAAPAGAAEAEVLVVGKSGQLVRERDGVRLQARTVRAGGRRCTVGGRTALAALVGTGVKLGLRDHGACSRRARDAGGLYVRSIAGVKESGRRSGWVYKVGRRLATSGAGDPAGAFGSGGLRDGARVSWFWCRLDAQGACPPTLEVTTERSAERVRATVRAYDDNGRGTLVEGATVRLGEQSATTGSDGTAELTGSGTLVAEKAGMIRSFGVEP